MDKKPNSDLPKFAAIQLAELVKQADTKAAATFSVLGIMAAALLARLTALKVNSLPMERMALYVVAGVLILVALKAIISVIFPRISSGSQQGFIYFKDILTRSRDEYIAAGTALSEEEVAQQFYRQAYGLATVVDAKYRALRYALVFTAAAIIWSLFILLVG